MKSKEYKFEVTITIDEMPSSTKQEAVQQILATSKGLKKSILSGAQSSIDNIREFRDTNVFKYAKIRVVEHS